MIRLDITRQMLKGTVIAGAAVFGPILFVVALAYAGMLLPEESKEAADPTPDSFGTPD
ncbi:MAG: RC-LH1 core complex protein PufX [Rhodobacteraceae bacterium]|nr:RC-LH1 core complex protein PufX [Paracoccaceae bacterium]